MFIHLIVLIYECTGFVGVVLDRKLAEETIQTFKTTNFDKSDTGQAKADGVLKAILQQYPDITERMAKNVFQIGTQRFYRIKRDIKKRKGGGLNGMQITTEMIVGMKKFVESLQRELGYPCVHRRQKQYIMDSKLSSWSMMYKKYKEFVDSMINEKKMEKNHIIKSENTFYKYIRKFHIDLSLHRTREDRCDTCMKFDVALKDPYLTDDDKRRILFAQKQHHDDSRAQRVVFKEAAIQWAQRNVDNSLVKDQFIKSLELYSDHVDDPLPKMEFGDVPNILLQAEDFGGNLCMPHYGSERPSADYYLSNLNVYMFIICSLSTNLNYIFLYDERAQGKDGNALCSLRFYYHLNLYQSLISSKKSMPKTLYLVLDNCVGQNKSQIVMMFFCFLSITLYDKVVAHYPVSGHSHMPPDKTCSHAKRALGKENLFHPHDMILRMNKVYSVMASYLDHTKKDCPFFDSWDIVFNDIF